METYLIAVYYDVLRYIFETSGWILALQIFFITTAFYALKGIYLLFLLRVLGRHHEAVSYVSGQPAKILIAGDSTAVGTGALDQHYTLGSMFARDFPKTDIINVGINGSRTQSVIQQLDQVSKSEFNLIIVSTGGNDVWAFTPLNQLEKDLTTVLRKAQHMSGRRTILLFFGNEGSAPFFPFFLRPIIMHRTELVRRTFHEVAVRENVPLIELFSDHTENPFVRDRKKYFAPDGLHPNDLGYWEWYKHLWRLMVAKNYTYHEHPLK